MLQNYRGISQAIVMLAVFAVVAAAATSYVYLRSQRMTEEANESLEPVMMRKEEPAPEAMKEDDAALEGEEAMKAEEPSVMMKKGSEAMESDSTVVMEEKNLMEVQMTAPEPVAQPEEAMEEQAPEEVAAPMAYSGTVLAGSVAPLLDFNQSDYEKATASGKLVVLYFYANWCPVCQRETSEALYPAFNALSNPAVVGFRVNFSDNQTDDNERALAREFGVAYQHTKVFVRNGERILKSPEEWNTERYASEINAAVN